MPSSDMGSLRWVLGISEKVAAVFLVVLLLASRLPGMPSTTARNVILVTAAYIALNGVFLLFVKYSARGPVSQLIQRMLMPFNVIACTLGLYAAGGVLTPVFITYPLVVLISIIVLDPKGVYWTAGLAIFLYCILTILEAFHIIPQPEVYWGTLDMQNSANGVTYGLYLLAVCSMLLVGAFMGNRIALLIRQRNQRIESQLGDLRALYDISNGLGNMIEEGAVLAYVADSLRTLQSCTLCLIGMVKKDGGIDITASSGVPSEVLSRYKGLTVDTPMLATLFRRGEPLILEDIDQRPEFRPLIINPTTRCAYAFPIKDKDRVSGAICVSFGVRKPLSTETYNLLSTIASQTGVALQRAQLLSNAQRLASEMSTLYDMGLHTGSTLSMREVIRRASDHIEKLLKPDTHYLALYDPNNDSLHFEIFKSHGHTLPRMTVQLDHGGITSRIIETRSPLLLQAATGGIAPPKIPTERAEADMMSYLGVPMISEDRVIGVISVQSAKPSAFDAHDQRLLMAMAAQTAMALENAKLHQFAQDQAKMDSLTQVCNHGYFLELVQAAVASSEKDGSPVSLIMLDIDFFKQYNDTHGHVAGDNVLKLVAGALKASVRATDFVGRWGGEEFGVLLPGTDIETAREIARRIRREVASVSPLDGYGRLTASPTISQGVSSFPFPSPSMAELVADADAALYTAKESGRNQLIIHRGRGAMPETVITSRLA